ncbi:MAG TPA: hypothetical protein VIR27_08395 [Mycobacteriales bacterium]
MPNVQIPARIRETAYGPDAPARPTLSEWVSSALTVPAVRVVVAVTGFGLLLSGAFLFLPLAGTDLSAQVARAHFTKVYGSQPIDFRWYSGAQQYGYSLFSTWIMAVVGTRGVGALSAVVSSLALCLLLVRTRVRRPLLGGMIGVVCFVSNLVSGRMTFALGVMFGLLGLVCLTLDGHPRARLVGAGVGAFLASAASPVAGLFSGLAGTALLLTGRRRDGLVTALAAAVPIGVLSTVFGEGGWMNFNQLDMIKSVGLSVAVALLVPARYRAVRIGAVLSAAGILLSYLVHTPVGSNSTRLAIMFAIPVIAATMRIDSVRHGAALLVVLTAWQPPLIVGDLFDAGVSAAHRPYYAPLLTELARREPLGRVEVPPTRDYWESVYVADTVPLARGWMRQVDIERNPLFFDGTLDAVTYQRWLYDNGVEYVALPDTTLSWVGRGEAELVRTGLPYLRPVWRSQHWALYEVLGARTVVEQPGRLVDSTATGITLQVSQPGRVLVRVRFTHWLTVEGPAACIEPAGRWSRLVASQPGIYHIGSRLQPTQPSRCTGS